MNPSRIAQSEIEPLPRWLRIALAWRCLGRVRPLVKPVGAQAKILDGVLDRIALAARSGQADDDVANAAAAAYTLALDHVDSKGTGADEDTIVVTCMLAHATAFAAEAATVPDPRQAAHLVAQSIDFAIHTARLSGGMDVGTIVAGMRTDLEAMQAAQRGKPWGEQEPVPEGFLV